MQQISPRVSVGLPVYNGARYLARSLESILGQDIEDFELIVSDNASTDDTPEICQHFAARDPRVLVLRQERNRGAAWNHNEIFRRSRAPFFKWAAHDDWCDSSYLRRCLEVFEQSTPSVVLVYPRTLLVSAAGEVLTRYEDRLDIRAQRPYQRLWYLVRRLALCNAFLGVIRRSALERTRLLGSFSSSDRVLLAELAMQGEFREVPEFLFYRRRHAESSREANKTSEAIARWFDPEVRSHRAPQLRLFREHLVSISRAPLGPGERALCALSFLLAYSYTRTRIRLGAARRRMLGRSDHGRVH
jgi:glycosyltransferase involved in cell wall biosynthesis